MRFFRHPIHFIIFLPSNSHGLGKSSFPFTNNFHSSLMQSTDKQMEVHFFLRFINFLSRYVLIPSKQIKFGFTKIYVNKQGVLKKVKLQYQEYLYKNKINITYLKKSSAVLVLLVLGFQMQEFDYYTYRNPHTSLSTMKAKQNFRKFSLEKYKK